MRAKKIDTNQNLIVTQLRKCGVSVAITSMVGKGFPDLIIGRAGQNFLIELKDGNKSKSRKKLTLLEETFFQSWTGQINIAENFDEIKNIIGL
jgi:hypothetical protein